MFSFACMQQQGQQQLLLMLLLQSFNSPMLDLRREDARTVSAAAWPGARTGSLVSEEIGLERESKKERLILQYRSLLLGQGILRFT